MTRFLIALCFAAMVAPVMATPNSAAPAATKGEAQLKITYYYLPG